MTGAERPAALQHGTIRLLLHVDVGLHGNRLPAAHRVDGDLLVLRTDREEEEEEELINNAERPRSTIMKRNVCS